MRVRRLSRKVVALTATVVLVGCGGEEFADTLRPEPGTGGTGGAAGSGGQNATGGNGGEAASSGASGESGTGGTGETGGTGGTSETGGTGGASETGGMGGAAGQAGAAGEGGTGGTTITCDPGWMSCDSDPDCETHVASDPLHCGDCNNPCPSGDHATPVCVSSVCELSCATGYEDCDKIATNGCEGELAKDVANCGQCGKVCPGGGDAACQSGACLLVCTSPYDDCDGVATNGCETNLSSNVQHCTACNQACPTPPHTTPKCTASACGYDCVGTWGDCNTSKTDGCETDTTSTTLHCGGCNKPCSTNHATPTCVSSACQLACHTGYGNCDNNVANGCEAQFSNNPSHCGQCGRSCLGATCSSGYCVPEAVATFSAAISDFGIASNYVVAVMGDTLYRAQFGASPTVLAESTTNGLVFIRTQNSVDIAHYSGEELISGTYMEYSFRSMSGVGSSQPTVVAGGPVDTGPQLAFLVTSSGTYWSTSAYALTNQRQIRYAAFGSGLGDLLVVPAENANSIAVGSTYVYWPETVGNRVMRVPTSGGTATEFATAQSQPKSVAAEGTTACWISQGTKQVRCKDHAGTWVTTVATHTQTPAHLTAVTDYFYWTVPDGSVHRWKRGDAVAVQLVPSGNGTPSLVRVSGNYVYWLDTSNRTVYRVAR